MEFSGFFFFLKTSQLALSVTLMSRGLSVFLFKSLNVMVLSSSEGGLMQSTPIGRAWAAGMWRAWRCTHLHSSALSLSWLSFLWVICPEVLPGGILAGTQMTHWSHLVFFPYALEATPPSYTPSTCLTDLKAVSWFGSCKPGYQMR